MYIIVNKHVIDVYKIRFIGGIQHICGETYMNVLGAYAGYLRNVKNKTNISLTTLCSDYKDTKTTNYRFYHTYLARVDNVLKACGMKNGIFRVCDGQQEFIDGGSIPWNMFPDTYYFALDYDDEIFTSGKDTTSRQVFSAFYNSEEEAEAARDKLLATINAVRVEAPKITI